MIISFSKMLNNKESFFEEKISQYGHEFPKVHTIRSLTVDKKGKSYSRFKPGDRIHFWMGNPRNQHTCNWMKAFSPAWANCYLWVDKNGDPALPPGNHAHRPKTGKQDPKPVIYATESICIDWQTVKGIKMFLIWIGREVMLTGSLTSNGNCFSSNDDLLRHIASRDGFQESVDFVTYFIGGSEKGKFLGTIVHWQKGNIYDPENAKTIEKTT